MKSSISPVSEMPSFDRLVIRQSSHASAASFWTWHPRWPSLPREHGAWAMVFTPPLIVAVGEGLPWQKLVLLLTAVASAFFAQNFLVLWLKERLNDNDQRWLWLSTSSLVLSAALLLNKETARPLFALGLLPTLFLAFYLTSLRRDVKLHRWLPVELFTVAIMVVGAPAAHLIGQGSMDAGAWALWGVCSAFFASSVFYLRMRFSALRHRGSFSRTQRWRYGRFNLLFHSVLLAGMCLIALGCNQVGTKYALLAFFPSMVRALYGSWTLESRIASVRRLGFLELGYTLWFATTMLFYLRTLAA